VATPIVIYGPTASGKSGLGMRLAQAHGGDGEILCADSAQVYRFMDVGTAKASAADRALVPHHGIDLVDPDQPMNAALWSRTAERALADMEARGKRAIVEGGTWLYLRALLEGLFEAPPPDAEIRRRHREQAATEGVSALHAQLAVVDPVAASTIAPTDLVRISRALEVYEQTGVALSEHWRRSPRRLRPCVRVVLLPPREDLYARIDDRATRIFAPLLDEVHDLARRGYRSDLPSQQALGYREAWDVAGGRIPSAVGLERLKLATRRYAKRQLSYLRSLREDPTVRVYTRPDEVEVEALPMQPTEALP
jgi:tRNA dimethylallyltransferase